MLTITREDVTLDAEDLIHDDIAWLHGDRRCGECGLDPCDCDNRPFPDVEDLYDEDDEDDDEWCEDCGYSHCPCGDCCESAY